MADEKEATLSDYTREEILKLIKENGGPVGLDLSARDLSGIDLSKEAIGAELEKVRERASCETPVWYSLFTRGINLGGANLQGTSLAGANLQEANLVGADLQGADLRSANLRRAYLWGAGLQRAYLGDATLPGADLRFANLQGASLLCTNLEGAKTNQRTIWPEGFEVPEGAVIED